MSFTTVATTANLHLDIRRKIEQVTEGLAASCAKSLYSVPPEIASTIADYVTVMRSEVNSVDSYRRDVVGALTKLSKYHHDTKGLCRNDTRRYPLLPGFI